MKNKGRKEGGRHFFAHFTNDLPIVDSCVRQAKWQYSQKVESNCNLFLALDSLNFKKGRL